VRDRIDVNDGGMTEDGGGAGGTGGSGATGGTGGSGATGGAGGSGATGGTGGMGGTPDCAATCANAIGCLYSENICRPLTPGEERSATASCTSACDANVLDRQALAEGTCSVQAEALLRAVPNLTVLCGIATEDQPCSTDAGAAGVCVGADACSGTADPTKCLGDSVCCAGIECGGADGTGVCVGANACEGRAIEAECPGTGTACCVSFNEVAGACTDNAECASGLCADEMSSGRVTPDGFCQLACENDDVCGDGAICLGSANTGICFQSCDEETPCREGWYCTAQRRRDAAGESVSVQVCLTDCRLGGCGLEGICNQETGICELMLEPEAGCPYACAEGEVCTDGRCLRANNSCATEYNCPENYECIDGTCRTGTFATCVANNPNSCAAGQTCVRTQDGSAFCIVTCQNNDVCPLNMSCQSILGLGQPNACYYEFCEQIQLNGACQVGGRNGTCRPLIAAAAAPGICLDAGTAEAGAVCDNEADPRTEEGAILACAPGSLCSGDEDDPLDPAHMNEGRGVCRALCQVGRDGCNEDQACVQLGRPDDPNTMENELFDMGLCFESDCTLFGDQCADGEACQPITFGAIFGRCRATGERGLGESCEDNTDCAANTICGNGGSGLVCIAFCDFQAQHCPWGQSCVPINGGAVHACL